MSPRDNDKRTVLRTYQDDEGHECVIARLTPHSDTTEKTILCRPLAVIPIVFIPGILATNLKRPGTGGARVWRPPNTDGVGAIMGALAQLFSYARKNAAKRKKELDPDNVAIDPNGPIDAEDVITEKQAHARGWGSVMRSAYHPMLAFLQRELTHIMELGELEPWWRDHAGYRPAEYGDEKSSPPLTLATPPGKPPFGDIDYAACHYHFDVWAAGYNWLQSNKDSAKDIKDYIDNTVLPFYRTANRAADKVILVTHSMGGLPSRALTELIGYDKVLGVVHGAQPATGAPAVYKRMRAGYEGVSQVILGRDAAEVTAVLASAPGGLELLPFADYHGGKPWLKVEDQTGETFALAEGGDPYAGIYQSDKWYGLVPRFNGGWMDPGSDEQVSVSALNKPNAKTPRDKFKKALGKVSDFQDRIAKRYHKKTHAFYGADNTDDAFLLWGEDRLTWGEIVWQADGPLGGVGLDNLVIREDDGNGTITLTNGTNLRIKAPAAPGDGTVPVASGAAPGNAGALSSFRIGNRGRGDRNEAPGFEHQNAFNDDRARWATLYAILKIARDAQWHD